MSNEMTVYKGNSVDKQTINEINALHEEIKSLMSQTYEKGLRIGDLLCRKKGELPHGEFQGWVDQYCPFTYRTARRYMLVFERKSELENAGIMSLAQAYKWLTTKSDTVSLLKDETNDNAIEIIDAVITEITDDDLSEQEREIERLRGELEALKEEKKESLKAVKILKKDNEGYQNLITNIKSMREVIKKITDIDKKAGDESLYELADANLYISKAEKFFLKHTAGIENLPINKLTIKAMHKPVFQLLKAMDEWGVRVAKKFKVKLSENDEGVQQ
ncbi:MAG: DUF3102 domain-containing protein [Spirochaetes bacterium]|nr:DUF3102 domain-containing protein [Spirochaetota bacterium]